MRGGLPFPGFEMTTLIKNAFTHHMCHLFDHLWHPCCKKKIMQQRASRIVKLTELQKTRKRLDTYLEDAASEAPVDDPTSTIVATDNDGQSRATGRRSSLAEAVGVHGPSLLAQRDTQEQQWGGNGDDGGSIKASSAAKSTWPTIEHSSSLASTRAPKSR